MSLYDEYQKETSSVETPSGGIYGQFLAEQNKVNEPSYLSRAISSVKDYAKTSVEQVPTFLSALRHPVDTIKKTTSVFSEPLMAGEQKAGEGLYQVVAEPGAANKVAGTAKLISGLAEAAFSPVTGLFHIAENTPGLKQVADTINIPFTATGFAGSWSTGKAIDWIPDSVVSKESKDIIKQPLQELGSLAAQMVVGGRIMKEIETRVSKGEVVTPEVAKEVVDKVKTETAGNPIIEKKPVSNYEQFQQEVGQKSGEVRLNQQTTLIEEAKKYKSAEEFVKAQGEPVYRASAGGFDASKIGSDGTYVTPSETIAKIFSEGGKRTIEEFYISPSAKVLEWKNLPEKFKNFDGKDIQEVQSQIAKYAKANGYDVVASEPKFEYGRGIEQQVVNPKVLQTKSQLTDIWNKANKNIPIETTGEQVPNIRARTLLEAATEKKLIEAVDTGEIPTHTRMNMAEQAKGAVDLIEQDKAKALEIAKGDSVTTGNILPESIYTALEIKAIKEGDVELMRQLAQSKLPTQAGQALKALDSADPNSPVKIMRDIQSAREAAIEQKTGKKVNEAKTKEVQSIKEKIPKVKKQTWDEFINELTCNY